MDLLFILNSALWSPSVRARMRVVDQRGLQRDVLVPLTRAAAVLARRRPQLAAAAAAL